MNNTMLQLSDRKFRIENMSKFMALKAVKSLIGHSETISSKSGQHWKHVHPKDILNVSSLEEVLRIWRWIPTVDSGGNIIDLLFNGNEDGDESILFHTIAPFVTHQSYLRCVINGRNVIWKFQGGRCIKEVV